MRDTRPRHRGRLVRQGLHVAAAEGKGGWGASRAPACKRQVRLKLAAGRWLRLQGAVACRVVQRRARAAPTAGAASTHNPHPAPGPCPSLHSPAAAPACAAPPACCAPRPPSSPLAAAPWRRAEGSGKCQAAAAALAPRRVRRVRNVGGRPPPRAAPSITPPAHNPRLQRPPCGRRGFFVLVLSRLQQPPLARRQVGRVMVGLGNAGVAPRVASAVGSPVLVGHGFARCQIAAGFGAAMPNWRTAQKESAACQAGRALAAAAVPLSRPIIRSFAACIGAHSTLVHHEQSNRAWSAL